MIELNLEEEKEVRLGANIKVVGIGGAGGNAVNSMVSCGDIDKQVEFMLANTDAQALATSPVETRIQLGTKMTKGLGAGSNPDIGRRAAEEDIEEVVRQINNTDILFLTAGLGGGTGSGALPVIAEVAKEMGILSVAVVTKPFTFEGKRRMRHAQEAIETLRKVVDTLIVVPNQKLLELVDPKISMLDAFALSNSVLKQAIKGISDIITRPGHINVDFADVRSVMKDMGMALMGTGQAEGDNRARLAAEQAISSQLLEDVNIAGAQGVLINITGNTDLGLHEINEAASVVYDMVSEQANIILGSVIDPEVGDEIKVTVIATGFRSEEGDVAREETSVIQPSIQHTAKEQGPVQTTASINTGPSEDEIAKQVRAALAEREKELAHAAEKTVKAAQPMQPERVVKRVEIKSSSPKISMPSPDMNESDDVDLADLDTPAFLRKRAKEKSGK